MDIIDEIEAHLANFRLKTDTEPLKLTQYTEDLQPADEPARFNKTWCKLALSEKLNRLMHYLAKVTVKLNLTSLQTEDLRKFFYEHVNNTLASDDCVNYDPTEGEIITIIGLKYEDNKFYIQTHSEPRPEGVRVKQRIFSNIDEFVNATAATAPASNDSAPAPTAPEHVVDVSEKKKTRKRSVSAEVPQQPKSLPVFHSPPMPISKSNPPPPPVSAPAPKKVVIIKKKVANV